MGTSKPDLLQIHAGLWCPDGRLKIFPLFVDRQRVAGHGDVGPHLGIVKFIVAVEQAHQTERDTKRPNGIPDAHKVHRTRGVRMVFAECLSVGPAGVVLFQRAFVHLPGFGDQRRNGSFENAAIIDQSAQCPNGIGTATETEKIDVIARVVVLNNVPVTIENVFMNAAASDARVDIAVVGTQPPVIKHLLHNEGFTIKGAIRYFKDNKNLYLEEINNKLEEVTIVAVKSDNYIFDLLYLKKQFFKMAIIKEINPKLLKRNEQIRKDYKHFADVKQLRDKKVMEILEEKYLPLSKTTIWLIITKTGFYKDS